MNITIGILNRLTDQTRKNLIRSTWGEKCKSMGVPYYFLNGDPNASQITIKDNDTMIIPCSDEYHYLPRKTHGFCEWVSKNGSPDYIFKCDDDTYLCIDRLIKFIQSTKRDYIGRKVADNVASGGAGYVLSRHAYTIVANEMINKDGAEDVNVGWLLRDKRILLHDCVLFDPALGVKRREPSKSNNMISTHYVDPESMNRIHKAMQ